jgi:hypothetical protein
VQTVALAPSPSGQGIYVLDERGRVATAGDAVPLGSLVANALGVLSILVGDAGEGPPMK